MFNRGSWLSLLPFVVACFTGAGIGLAFTGSAAHHWYPELKKPEWNPPIWIFGRVWSVLYLMMALSAWRVWRGASWPAARIPLVLFAIQLVLNTVWSIVFFGMRAIGPAFGEILLLWMMIVATAVSFYPLSLLATWLLIPYIGWVGFASYLNFRIWQMN